MQTTISPTLRVQLKSISIRGRMALAITCLETVLTDLEVAHDEMTTLLEFFWQFVEQSNVEQWAYDRHNHQLLQAMCDYADGWASTKPQQYSVGKVEDWVYQLVFQMVELGLTEIDALIMGHSHATYAACLTIVQLVYQQGYAVPPLDPFLKSDFRYTDSQGQKGWGQAVPRAFFKGTKSSP